MRLSCIVHRADTYRSAECSDGGLTDAQNDDTHRVGRDNRHGDYGGCGTTRADFGSIG